MTAAFCLMKKPKFIEGYYIVGLLAEVFLRKQPGAKIMYDPRLTWNTQEVVDAAAVLLCAARAGMPL